MSFEMAQRLMLALGLGAGVGFCYQKLVGCRAGACPLTATPLRAMLYGAFIGLICVLASHS